MAAYSVVHTPEGGYTVRNQETKATVAEHLDADAAAVLAWALAYRDHIWEDLCTCREHGDMPAWHPLHPYAFVCERCGGFLQKVTIGASGGRIPSITLPEGEGKPS